MNEQNLIELFMLLTGLGFVLTLAEYDEFKTFTKKQMVIRLFVINVPFLVLVRLLFLYR